MTARSSLNPWQRLDAGRQQAFTEHSALMDKLNEEARQNWDNPLWHRQVAADVAETLDYGFTFSNEFGQYLRVDTVGEFDRVVLRERRGLKVFYTSRGGYIDESQIKDEIWTLPRDTLGFHVSEFTDKLRANYATAISDLVALGEERLNAEVWRRVFALLQEAIPSGSNYYVETNGLTKPEVDQALREVRDAIKPNGQGPAPVTIIGRAAMVDQISDFNLGFDPTATEEIRRNGRLGSYRNANLQQVINYTDEDGVSFIPANELWIFGGDVGRFALYGGLQFKQWEENTVDYTHYRARKDIGGLVHHPEQARRIIDTSVTP